MMEHTRSDTVRPQADPIPKPKCRYYGTQGGCSRGAACRFAHVWSADARADSRPVQAANQLRSLCREIARGGGDTGAGIAWANEADRRIRALTAQLRNDAAARGLRVAG